MGIETKLDRILRGYGHNIFLRKERNGETIWERHTVRSRYPAIRGLPEIAEEQEEGRIHSVDMIFYFKANALPREGDRIYEEDPRYSGTQPVVQWIIDYAVPHRGKGGKVIYYSAGVTRAWPN